MIACHAQGVRAHRERLDGCTLHLQQLTALWALWLHQPGVSPSPASIAQLQGLVDDVQAAVKVWTLVRCLRDGTLAPDGGASSPLVCPCVSGLLLPRPTLSAQGWVKGRGAPPGARRPSGGCNGAAAGVVPYVRHPHHGLLRRSCVSVLLRRWCALALPVTQCWACVCCGLQSFVKHRSELFTLWFLM
jgi:hypothetical protein